MRRRGISKDARGNEVHQVGNATDGTLTSVTDSNGQTVNYTYDASKRVTGVTTTGDGKTYKNAYTYENDRIKTVSHNTTGDAADVTYTFHYDELGRKTTVKVGSQTACATTVKPATATSTSTVRTVRRQRWKTTASAESPARTTTRQIARARRSCATLLPVRHCIRPSSSTTS